MMVRIYLDVYFAVNFALDYLILFLVKRLLCLPGRFLRMSAAAGAGAAWACLVLVLPGLGGWLGLIITWFLVGGAMVALAFGIGGENGGLRELGVRLAVFWMVGAGLGGLLGLWNSQDFTNGYFFGMGPFPLKSLPALCLWVAGAYFGVSACLRLLQRQGRARHSLYQVKLCYKGATKTVNALWDTGNQLYEPYSHQPVHVITSEACRQFCGTVNRIIYIPFRTVGAEYGLMPGIRIDFMEVERDGRLLWRYERPWLAISKNPLSAACRYEMLLHGEEHPLKKDLEGLRE